MLQPPIFLLRTIVFSLLLFPLESVTQTPPSLSVIAIFKQLATLAIPGAQQFKDMRISTDTALTEQNLNHALALIGKYRDTLNQETYELLKAQITKKLATLRQHRAPRPPLDTGDESSTGDVGDTFEPVSASGFVLPDDVNVVHNLTVGNDATVNGNLVINGGLVFHGDIVLEPTCPDTDIAVRFNTCTGTEIARIYTPSVVGGLAISTNSGVTENFRVQADGNSQTTGNLIITGVTYANGGVDRSTAAVLNVGTVNATGVNIGNGAATVDMTGTTISHTGLTEITAGNEIQFFNPLDTFHTGIKAGALLADRTTLVLPLTNGAASDVLINDGAANLSWGSVASIGAFIQNGNSFGAPAVLGTNDDFSLSFETDGTTRLSIADSVGGGAITATPAIYANGGLDRSAAAVLNVGTVNATGVNIGTTAATTVTIGNVANTTALELPYGYVTTGGSSYINNFGTSNSFFAGLYAGNTAVANTGISNTGIGSNALPSITTGNENTAIGAQALLATTTGSANTACGSAALTSTTGSNNVGVGYHAGMSATSGNNNIYLGYSETGVAGESNTIRLGANATLAATRCFIGGIDGTALGSQAKLVGIVSKQLGTTDASGFTLGGTLYTDSGIDTITATALNIGTTNATSVNVGRAGATTVDVLGITTNVTGSTTAGIDGLTVNLGNTTATTINMGTTASTDINIGRAGTSTLDILGTTLNVTGTTTAVTGSTSARLDGLTVNVGNTLATGINIGTTTATTVTIGNVANATAVELPYGYVTKGGSRYINNFGGDSFFAGENAGNTAIANTGISNTGIGFYALSSTTTGYSNTAVGSRALLSTTTGSTNTTVGSDAGTNIITGSGNTYIGSGIGFLVADESNTTRIGSLGATRCFIGGIAGAGPFANAVTINPADGQLGGLVSSRRYKENITPLDSQDRFMQLNPVSFTYKNDAEKSTWYGLIAEEVEPIYPELAIYGKDKQLESVAYLKLYGILIKELQTALKKIALLDTERILSKKLEKELHVAHERINTLEKRLAALE